MPVARMKRAIGCSVAATAATATTGGAVFCSLALASPALHAPEASAAAGEQRSDETIRWFRDS